jgi:hypothetical protein
MESLALLVCAMFLCILLSGPLALISCYFNFNFITILLALFAITSGTTWCFFAPFPFLLLGSIGIFCGVLAIQKL